MRHLKSMKVQALKREDYEKKVCFWETLLFLFKKIQTFCLTSSGLTRQRNKHTWHHKNQRAIKEKDKNLVSSFFVC